MHLSVARRMTVLTALSAILGVVALGRPGAANASSFTVGGCSTDTLIAFIEAANSEIDYPGGDTIYLSGSCTFMPSAAYGSTDFAFPPITTDITIVGNGAHIQLQAGATASSYFDVAATGSLILSDVTLAAGSPSVRNAGSATLSQVTVSRASPNTSGGIGVENGASGVMNVLDSTFEGRATSGGSGAIENHGNLTVVGSRFHDAALHSSLFSNGTAAIYSSTFSANGPTPQGGAIQNQGSMEIHDSSFTDNEASSGGAIMNNSAAVLTVAGSYFGSNDASIEGGAIVNGASASAQVDNSTFYHDIATTPFLPCCATGQGGAIVNHNSLGVRHATFSLNGAASGTDVASPEGVAFIGASIFDFPRGGGGACSGTISDLGSNLTIAFGSCPSTFTVGNAHLSSPAVHGAGTKTLALGPGSAAVDIVPVSGCPAYDQRGFSRPAGSACDAGALEDQVPSVPGSPALSAGTNPNQGSFTLSWTASTDPDGTPVTYRLYRKDADDAGYTAVGSGLARPYALTGESEGTITYKVAADDGNHVSGQSGASSPIVVDTSAPTGPTATPDRAPDAVGWYLDTVTVTFSGSTDPALGDGSAGSGVALTTTPQTVSTSGTQTVTGTATDAAGNVSTTTVYTVSVDADPPSIAFGSCPATAILARPASVGWTASDAESGLATASSGTVGVDTSTIGTRLLQASATDNVGHVATATCSVNVIYDFKGFNKPVMNLPAFNKATAGGIFSLSFSLGGSQGLAIFAPGYPASTPIACGSTIEATIGTPTVGASPALVYGGGRYTYAWKTDKSWAGTCRQFIVLLTDGTYHRANFAFK